MINAVSEVTACEMAEIFDHPSFPRLWAEAAEECANPDMSAVDPDRAFYQTLEASGYARFFRCGVGGEMYGFASLLVAPSGANGKRYGTVERLFVDRAHRAGGAGSRMMVAIEAAARDAGCEAITYSAHVGTSLARLLFLYTDVYKLTNFIFCRRLA